MDDRTTVMEIAAAASCKQTAAVPGSVRAAGKISARFERNGGRTALSRLYEEGGLRLRFPRCNEGCEAVLINTAGGIAGGDRARLLIEVGAGAEVCLTTPSAEKIYRTQSQAAEIDARVILEAGARLEMLPQETILFDGAKLARRLEADLAASASFTLVEAVVFGRLAMGEQCPRGNLNEHRRIRRAGALLYAEDVDLDGNLAALLGRRACGGGARMLATLVHAAPNAEALLDAVRGLDADQRHPAGPASRHAGMVEWGASAWNGMLVIRFAAGEPQHLRMMLAAVLGAIRGRPLPRVWQ